MPSVKQSQGRGCSFWFGILLVFSASLVGYVIYDSPKVNIRYRIDLSLQIDGQPVMGSVVQEFVIRAAFIKMPHSNNIGYGVKGEAMALSLPNDETLFLLMELPQENGSWTRDDRWRYRNFFRKIVKVPWEDSDRGADYVRKYRTLSGTYDVPLKLLPLLVKYTKEGDFDSAIRIIPRAPDTVSQPVKGNEIVIQSATLTITEQPASQQISDKHAWLLKDWGRPNLVPEDKAHAFSWSFTRNAFTRD